ncbi:hypothetical protein [Cloacibacterium sp.]|uniref:hypothetical protein n=1 Tax=Cloacibacterium sp. TaxID=1913682 RepID=UPI0039E6EDAB
MRKLTFFPKILLLFFLYHSSDSNAQYVGINISNPQKELDINGELKVRTINQVSNFTGNESVLIVSNTDNVVQRVDPSTITNSATNASALSVKKSGNLNLLNLSFDLTNNWKIVQFSSSDIQLGSTSNYANSIYTVPSTGIYKIGYYFRYGDGIQTTLLSTQPILGILKTTGNTISVLDSRDFQGVNLYLASLNLTENSIDSIYSLQAGDKIVFALNTGGLSLSLLNSSSSSAYIYKISN